MSGRKQHYLPQFLQRPFAHRESNGMFYVHVHELHNRYSPNTAGVGAIRDFYSTPQNPQADDNITATETALAATIGQIILSETLPPNDQLARLFSSLSLRTLKMRNAMSELAPDMIAALRKKFATGEWATEAFQKQIGDKRWLDDIVEKELKRAGRMDRNKRAVLKAELKSKFMKEINKNAWLDNLRAQADIAMSSLEEKASTMADEAMSKVFSEPNGLDKRNELFSKFNYTLIKDSSDGLLLGDCAVTALDSNHKPRLAMGDVDDEITLSEVILPISPRLAIHGTLHGKGSSHAVSEINELSVKLSNTFFISLERTNEEVERLRPLIGSTVSPIVSLEELSTF